MEKPLARLSPGPLVFPSSLPAPSIRQYGILRDDHDPVQHVPIWAADSLDLPWVADHLYALPNMTVLVDDRIFDDRAITNPNWRPAVAGAGRKLVGRFVKIGAHDHGIADCHIPPNPAPQAHDAVFNPRSGADRATIGYETMLHRRAFASRGGQGTRSRVNRRCR